MKPLRVVAYLLALVSILFTVFWGKDKIADNGVKTSPTQYKGIITLWNIDSFEGGTGSRKQFLMTVARAFEKSNSGVLIMATDYTAENAERELEKGNIPDMLSYGTGVKVTNLKPLELNCYSAGGGYNGQIYAVPWCKGGYCLIKNPNYIKGKTTSDALLVSQGEYTNPLLAYAMTGKRAKEIEVLTPFNAYLQFVSQKNECMVGTQRDINRLVLRGMEFVSTPLNEYNDLFQYISVTTNDQTKYEYCQSFAKFLLSEEVQTTLYKIGMLSALYKVAYEDPDMRELQNASTGYSLSAFSSKELIKELQQKSGDVVRGDEDEFIKIKNLLSMS